MNSKKIYLLIVVGACLVAFCLSAFAIDEKKAVEFIKSCQNVEGRMPNLRLIYPRVMILDAAGQLGENANFPRYVSYIRTCCNKDGGYGWWPRDVSSVEATFQALGVLEKLGAKPSRLAESAEFLESQLGLIGSKISEYPYPGYAEGLCRQLYQALIGLHILGRKPQNLQTLVNLLKKAPKTHGIFYYVRTSKIYGLKIKDREELIHILDKDAEVGVLRSWSWGIAEKHHCVAAMAELGGTFEDDSRVKHSLVQKLEWVVRESELFLRLKGVYHASMLAKHLNPNKSLWGQFVKSTEINLGSEGGFGSFPGGATDEIAILYALKVLKSRRIPIKLDKYIRSLKEKQKPDGFFELSRVPEWLEESRKAEICLNDTWIGISILNSLDEKPSSPDSCVSWLQGTLDKWFKDMDVLQVFRLLESFHLLGHKLQNPEKIIAFLQQQKSQDSYHVIRSLQLLGEQPENPKLLREKIKADLGDIRNKGFGLGFLYRKLLALESLGGSVDDSTFYENHIKQLQNPDGGFRKTVDEHSNIYDTSIALDVWEILQRMK